MPFCIFDTSYQQTYPQALEKHLKTINQTLKAQQTTHTLAPKAKLAHDYAP